MRTTLSIGIAVALGALPCACSLLVSLDGFDSEGESADGAPPSSDSSTSSNGDGAPTHNDEKKDASSPVTLGSAYKLATVGGTPRTIAIDKDYVYWHNTSGSRDLMRVERRRPSDAGDAGGPTSLRSVEYGVSGVVVTGTKIALTQAAFGSYSLAIFQRDGNSSASVGAPIMTTGAPVPANRLSSYGETLFAYNEQAIYSASNQGGSGIILLQNSSVSYLTVDASNVYFVSGTNLVRMPKSGADAGTTIVASVGAGVRGTAVDDARVYWIDDGGQILAVDKTASNGTPQILASEQAGPSSIALDSTGIFWTNAVGGTVMRIPKEGGEPVVVTGQPAASLIAADDNGAVWLRDGTEIIALPRE